MLPIQAKPVSRSAQPEAAKVAPQIEASYDAQKCQFCSATCALSGPLYGVCWYFECRQFCT